MLVQGAVCAVIARKQACRSSGCSISLQGGQLQSQSWSSLAIVRSWPSWVSEQRSLEKSQGDRRGRLPFQYTCQLANCAASCGASDALMSEWFHIFRHSVTAEDSTKRACSCGHFLECVAVLAHGDNNSVLIQAELLKAVFQCWPKSCLTNFWPPNNVPPFPSPLWHIQVLVLRRLWESFAYVCGFFCGVFVWEVFTSSDARRLRNKHCVCTPFTTFLFLTPILVACAVPKTL